MNVTNHDDEDSLITPAEKSMLDEAMHTDPLSTDEINLKHSYLDNVDEDGDPLNEISIADDNSGDDLDIPGAEDDDADEELVKKMKRIMVTARQTQHKRLKSVEHFILIF